MTVLAVQHRDIRLGVGIERRKGASQTPCRFTINSIAHLWSRNTDDCNPPPEFYADLVHPLSIAR
jgi:hypothetical protein